MTTDQIKTALNFKAKSAKAVNERTNIVQPTKVEKKQLNASTLDILKEANKKREEMRMKSSFSNL